MLKEDREKSASLEKINEKNVINTKYNNNCQLGESIKKEKNKNDLKILFLTTKLENKKIWFKTQSLSSPGSSKFFLNNPQTEKKNEFINLSDNFILKSDEKKKLEEIQLEHDMELEFNYDNMTKEWVVKNLLK